MPLTADVDMACRNKAAKCRSYLEVADVALGSGYYDAAVSLSVSAAVNAADLFLLTRQGRYSKGGSHQEAMSALRKHGAVGSDLARRLGIALKNKTKAQYEAARCSVQEAETAFLHAQRMTETACLAYGKEVN
ncbi:HEPN domain-containing protein [Micromonospora carbonacea]|uniref:HEPN domain-containing protein n=1 Tax=Micromonospora carbonacea TaxID=47853 RepID=UPI00331B8E3A